MLQSLQHNKYANSTFFLAISHCEIRIIPGNSLETELWNTEINYINSIKSEVETENR